MKLAPILAAALAITAVPARAAEPTAMDVLAKYDEVMGPKSFEAEAEMTAHREDGSVRAYAMKMLKGENDRFRIWFDAPAAV